MIRKGFEKPVQMTKRLEKKLKARIAEILLRHGRALSTECKSELRKEVKSLIPKGHPYHDRAIAMLELSMHVGITK